MKSSSEVVLRTVALTKIYPAAESGGRGEVVLFQGLDFLVNAGEMVALVGESGAGKSSLLHLLAGLDKPTSGEIWCRSRRVDELSSQQAAVYRSREVGYLWQMHYLLPEFSAVENVAMPLLAQGVGQAQATERAMRWLGKVGLIDRAGHRSGELSGGEQQRVSLARALATEPEVLLADEPTGNLDARTAEAVFQVLQRVQQEYGLTGVLVTHNLDIARRCDRTMHLRNGKLT